MKRFYGLLFVAAALVSGTVFGMEKEVDIRDYADVVEYLTTTAHFRADDEFESLATTLPAIEDFILTNNKQDEKQYATLCGSYLNKKFALSECDSQQVEMMFMERFFGDSSLASFYSIYRQEIINQLNLDKLAATMRNVTDKKPRDLDTLLMWLSIFDGTDHAYEVSLADALKAEIDSRGLTSGMQPWEKSILQKGADLQGLSKKYIDTFRQKEQATKDERQKLRAQAEQRKDQKTSEIFGLLKGHRDTLLDELLQDELVGDDAPLGDYSDYINTEIQKRIQSPAMKNNKEVLLNKWNAKFNALQQQQQELEDLLRIEEQQRQEQTNQTNQEQLSKSTLEDLLNQYKPQSLNLPNQPQQDQPDVGGGQPRPDAPKGLAVLCAAIAPKLAIMAVVVGVGYWGYTKYTAYKAAQQKENADKDTQDKQQNTPNKKQSAPSTGKRRK